MFERIIGDPAFSPVWDSLAKFVARPRRALVFVLGNHDIEIALPVVQRRILERLAGNDLAARARIEFSTMGAGYSCYVGNARVFCTHGNEVDQWNYIRYEGLAKAARRINSGRALDVSEWEPNAGTKMVKDIMNGIKSRYAWVDLLKPETNAAVGVLLALDPGQVKKFKSILPVVGVKLKASADVDHRLSADAYVATGVTAATDVSVDSLLGANLRQVARLGPQSAESADDMLEKSESRLGKPSAGAGATDETLGTPQLVWDQLTGWLTGVSREEALRSALLDWLKGDTTFDLDDKDDTYKAISPTVGEEVDFVITGHTHLARALTMGPRRYYFNCGTWIRLMRFPDAMLKDKVAFKSIYDALVDGSMNAIDRARFDGEPLVMDRATAVSIRSVSGRVTGELIRILDTIPITHELLKTLPGG